MTKILFAITAALISTQAMAGTLECRDGKGREFTASVDSEANVSGAEMLAAGVITPLDVIAEAGVSFTKERIQLTLVEKQGEEERIVYAIDTNKAAGNGQLKGKLVESAGESALGSISVACSLSK